MSFVLRKYKWFRAIRELRPVSEILPAGAAFLSDHFFLFLVWRVVFFDEWRWICDWLLTINNQISLVRPSAKWWWHTNMILSPANDAKWREHESSEKLSRLRVNDRKMTWKMTECRERLEKKVTSTVSLVIIDRNLPVQITLSIYTFKYTHTTLGFTTQWRMRWWMLKWVNGYGRGDNDSDDTDYDGAVLPYFRQTR